MSEVIMRIENITKKFPVSHGKFLTACDNISFSVKKGETVAIVGESGCGKTTLLKIIMNMLAPTAGKIIFDGVDITEKNITERAKLGISFAFQQPVKFKGIKVIDLLRLAAGKKISFAKACDYLAEVGLCARDYINREVNSSLSGGELKRIEIATIIARKTKLSIFDEPEAGIDLWSFQNLIKIFESMRENISESSIIVISHQERILNIADEIIVIEGGRVINQGSVENILPKIIGTDSAIAPCKKISQ